MSTARRRKAIKRVNPFYGTLATLQQVVNPDRSYRASAIQDEWEGVIVDTCVAFDTGLWETAVSRDSEKSWVIVDQYEDESTARAGHKEWVQRLKEKPNLKLKDLDLWGLNKA